MSDPTSSTDHAGYRLRDWCRCTSISRSHYYELGALRPTACYIGRRLIITESPMAWLARVGRAQATA